MVDTINIKDLSLLEWALLKLVFCHIRHLLQPSLVASTFTDALGLTRYKIDCPGDRYGKCKRWRKVHIYCLCSRGFDTVTKQLGENLLVFSTKDLEMKRFKIEAILRCRYQSFIKLISQYFDKCTEHEESEAHRNPCIECYKNQMYLRYFQKKLEVEFSQGTYFDHYLALVDDKKPLDTWHLEMAFTDWIITNQVEHTKRKLEQNENRRKKLKDERDSREEQNKILLNPH